jgi:hypothetical protein
LSTGDDALDGGAEDVDGHHDGRIAPRRLDAGFAVLVLEPLTAGVNRLAGEILVPLRQRRSSSRGDRPVLRRRICSSRGVAGRTSPWVFSGRASTTFSSSNANSRAPSSSSAPRKLSTLRMLATQVSK